MNTDQKEFLRYLPKWVSALPLIHFHTDLPEPSSIALISVDLINGFCNEGPLSSQRVKTLIQPIRSLFILAHQAGVTHFVLTQDSHVREAVEFSAYPPHCVRGTTEADTVAELRSLPFFSDIQVFEKNSIHSGMNTGFQVWLDKNQQLDTFIIVGDCTDLCIYQLAMQLRLEANARQIRRRVIVPADCVDTYDMPVKTALKLGGMPHNADLLHQVFLYHMALNDIEIVASIK